MSPSHSLPNQQAASCAWLGCADTGSGSRGHWGLYKPTVPKTFQPQDTAFPFLAIFPLEHNREGLQRAVQEGIPPGFPEQKSQATLDIPDGEMVIEVMFLYFKLQSFEALFCFYHFCGI